MALLLLTSCATQSPMVIHRDMAVDYDSVVEEAAAQDIAKNFGRRSKSPDEIKEAYRAFQSGNMSLSVLKKLSKEYPAFQGSVSAVIYKDVLKVIHLENKMEGPVDGKLILEDLFKDYQKTFSYRLETDD